MLEATTVTFEFKHPSFNTRKHRHIKIYIKYMYNDITLK